MKKFLKTILWGLVPVWSSIGVIATLTYSILILVQLHTYKGWEVVLQICVLLPLALAVIIYCLYLLGDCFITYRNTQKEETTNDETENS